MRSKNLTIIAGLFGNTLEWYDFILYANFAPIFAQLFFPAHDPLNALLLTFAVFATGFIVRPFGAVIFGYIGDHLGRRIALITSITLITVPTFLIGFIPSYDHIGLAAPVILTLLRLLQGIAISGELNSAATYLIEHAKPNRRGYVGSLIMGTAFFGIFLGALASYLITNCFTQGQILSIGWRIPFWFSGLLGVVGLFLRLKSKESPKFLAEAHLEKQAPLRRTFKYFRKEILLTVLLTMIMAVGNYTYIAYIVTFLVKTQGLSLATATTINLISMLICVGFFPLMGLLSDKIGRKPVYKTGILGFIVFSVPIFWLLSQPNFYLILLGDVILGLFLVPVAGIIPTIIAELFPTSVRNCGSAIGYNISLALFGGTTPLVALKLVQLTQNNYAPAYYLMLAGLISAITLYFVEDRYAKNLH